MFLQYWGWRKFFSHKDFRLYGTMFLTGMYLAVILQGLHLFTPPLLQAPTVKDGVAPAAGTSPNMFQAYTGATVASV